MKKINKTIDLAIAVLLGVLPFGIFYSVKDVYLRRKKLKQSKK